MIYHIDSDHYFSFLIRWQEYQKKWNKKYGDPNNPTILTYSGKNNSNWNADHL
jgi:hypothetical protein